MVYESEFYTTRRPYRHTPSLSTYTVSSAPSRQVRLLPGLGKVHVVHTYDRIVPYVGHKRLSVVTTPPIVVRVRPSTLYREYDRIENKMRPINYYSPTSHYLNSNSAVSYKMIYVRNPSGHSYYTAYRPITEPTIRTSYYRRSPYTGNYYLTYDDDPFPYYFPRRVYEKSPITGNYYLNYLPSLYYYNRPYLPHLRTWWSYEKSNVTGDYYLTYNPPLYRYLSSYYPSYLPNWRNWYYNWYDSPLYRTIYPYTSSYAASFGQAFDDETRFIKAQTAALMKRVHTPVPRVERSWSPIHTVARYDDTPARWSSDNYIYRMLMTSPNNPKITYTAYYTEPIRRYLGQGHLAAVTYVGDKAHLRRPHIRVYTDPVQNDIQLLSYYINRFKEQKAQGLREPTKVKLNPARPTRVFSIQKPLEDTSAQEIAELREARAQRLAKIYEVSDAPVSSVAKEDPVKVSQQKKAEARVLAEEHAKKAAEDQAKKAAQAKKDEAARKAELARQEELAAQAAAERAAEMERKAEQAKQEELAKQAEIEKAKKLEEERAKQEEERKAAEAAKAEEERQQLLRLEEIARQAEAEKEAELARQAEELAELARQEAELAEQARLEEEQREKERKEAEEAEIARQAAELVELEQKEKELAEAARVEAELAEKARQEAELAELLRQKAELDALEAEAMALLEPVSQPSAFDEVSEVPAELEVNLEVESEAPAAEESAFEESVEEPAVSEAPADSEEPAASEEPAEASEPVVDEPVTSEAAEEAEE